MDVLKNPRTAPKDELLNAYLKPRPAADGTNVIIPAIEVINPFLVQINLNHAAYSPRRFFCFRVVKYDSDAKFWDRKKHSPYRFTPVGTGPYVMDKRRSRKITFKKNEHYGGDNQNIGSVSFKRFDDRKSMLQACFFNHSREDAIDIIPSLLPDEIAAFEEDPRHYIADLNLYNFYFIGFNFADNGALYAILNKLPKAERGEIALGIREAMLIGFDRESTLKIYGKAPGEILEGPYPAGSWAYSSEDKKKRRYAPGEAKATLAAIGFKGGRWQQNKRVVLKFRLCYRQGDTYYERVAAKFADAMDNIGIEIIPIGITGPMWQKTIYQQRDFDLVLDRYLYREDMDISPFFSSSGGVLGYQNRLLNEYLAKIKNSQLRKDELQGLYQAMDRFLWNNSPVIFLWSLNQSVGVRSNLAENIVGNDGGKTIEPIRALDGYDFFGNISRWQIQKDNKPPL
jgi:ABC-type transport system substrate-binding protein